MNKRIIQLITEADTYAWSVAEKYVAGDGCNDGEVNYLWEDAFREKFAELIVRECANIAHNKQYKHSPAHTVGDCATAIKEHFGVEQ